MLDISIFLLLCPKWAADRQHYFGDSTDFTDVFRDSENLLEFPISLRRLPGTQASLMGLS